MSLVDTPEQQFNSIDENIYYNNKINQNLFSISQFVSY